MSKVSKHTANKELIAKSLQLKYNEVLQSFFTKQNEISLTNEIVDTDNEMLDIVKLLKYYYACPPQNNFTNILDKIKGME